MSSEDAFDLARALASLRRFLDDELEPAQRAELINAASASDEVVAGFLAALPGDQLAAMLIRCTRPGVLAVWAHSIGRAFRAAVAGNPWVSDETLVLLASDYDEAVSAAAYAALVARAHEEEPVKRD
jgi:hypothetical protein